MSAAIAYLLIVGTLLALAARAGEEALRLARRPTRWAWIASIGLFAVLAIRAAATAPQHTDLPAYRLAPPGTSVQGAGVDTGPWSAVATSIERIRDAAGRLPALITPRLSPAGSPRVAIGVGVAWGATTLVLFAVFVFVYRRFSVATRALPSTEVAGTRVRVSRNSGPGVIGIVDPQIIVPAWLLHADPEEQRLAVAHERQHILAYDPQLLVAACVTVAVLPWHPAAWWMLARLRLAVEMDCDRRVIASGVARRVYGTTLVDIAERCRRLPLGVPGLADHSTYLERRLIAMAPNSMKYRHGRLLAIGAAALLATAAACEARVPSSPEIEAMDVAAVERNPMAKLALGNDTTATYFVDGREVTAEGARAIRAGDIAQITVSKSQQRSEIHIVTKTEVAKASLSAPAPPPGYSPLGLRDYPGLIIVDGEPADGAALAHLTPDRVESMTVIKGSMARQQYADPKAANGVIVVVTKH